MMGGGVNMFFYIIILDWTDIPDLLMYSIVLCFSRAAMDLVVVADRVKWH